MQWRFEQTEDLVHSIRYITHYGDLVRCCFSSSRAKLRLHLTTVDMLPFTFVETDFVESLLDPLAENGDYPQDKAYWIVNGLLLLSALTTFSQRNPLLLSFDISDSSLRLSQRCEMTGNDQQVNLFVLEEISTPMTIMPSHLQYVSIHDLQGLKQMSKFAQASDSLTCDVAFQFEGDNNCFLQFYNTDFRSSVFLGKLTKKEMLTDLKGTLRSDDFVAFTTLCCSAEKPTVLIGFSDGIFVFSAEWKTEKRSHSAHIYFCT
ncbi:hypothetical protein ADEAN_000513500 [Angomonas deanei]|uniref:Uncharacterized protein n=1 Tax=Angomonas deanei TaxID=59799 RepID=A0A7G2CCV4_9TRYP|nr:hypothetical protein ADEAN_000513500 [Angomonas deanei]